MNILQATEGKWLYNGETFAKKIMTGGATSMWHEVTDEYKQSIERVEPQEMTDAKETKLAEIEAYDASNAVNSFSYQGVQMWIPKELRISLMNSSTIEKASGKTDTSLWYEGVRFDLPIDTLQMLLGAIEMYALECYNVTESHKASVRAMTSVEEIEGYDYRQCYPDKLVL